MGMWKFTPDTEPTRTWEHLDWQFTAKYWKDRMSKLGELMGHNLAFFDEFGRESTSMRVPSEVEADFEVKKHVKFLSNFWDEKLYWAANGDPNAVRADGHHYYISKDDPGGFQGFGGREWKILFLDGRKVVSRNLWSQGEIPPAMRDKLPDNARFE